MAKQAGSKTAQAGDGAKAHLHVAHRIEALLRTMRVIERHEEQLCVVMTEIRHAGVVSGAARKELRLLLDELPGDVYQADLEAVGKALVEAGSKKENAHTAESATAKRPVPRSTIRKR